MVVCEQRAGEQTDPSQLFLHFPLPLKLQGDAGKEVSPPPPATCPCIQVEESVPPKLVISLFPPLSF